jgi:hypothetical protein
MDIYDLKDQVTWAIKTLYLNQKLLWI